MKTRELIDLELIDDNPWQPRGAIIEDEGLRELADSIHEIGLLQAPLGRRTEVGRVQSAFGHRRTAACRLLHAEGKAGPQIEMDVAELTDEQMAIMALTENERRKQLTQIEVLRAHKRAIDETSLTVQDLADRLGLDRSTVSNNLRVLELPDFVLEHVESGALRISAARDFLVLQNGGHAHTKDMGDVVTQITRTWGDRGAPDWSRRHVRQLICKRVSFNETDFRPLGPRPRHFEGGAAREAAFDIDAFSAAHQGALHTIPADGDGGEKYDSSRVWTCDVKAWRNLQTQSTREANKEAKASGQERPASSNNKNPGREEQFSSLLATDPVWVTIAAAREKPGPARPVVDEEREQLGSRAQFQEIGHNEKFWKVLQKARAEDVYSWDKESGGLVPPWFPDLKECQRKCTIGAAYAKSKYGYPLNEATLVCFNKEHYQEKLQAGEAKHKAKMEEQRVGMDRQDLKAVKKLAGDLQGVSDAGSYAILLSTLTAEPRLEWLNPLGAWHKDYSYESASTARARELLGLEPTTDHRGRSPQTYIDLAELASIETGNLRELVASLLTHHLRLAGRIEAVSWEPAESTTTNDDENADEKRRRLDRERKQRQREEGKCHECTKDALPGLTVCAQCRDAKKLRNALRYSKGTPALAGNS